jgi:hypothetical protein
MLDWRLATGARDIHGREQQGVGRVTATGDITSSPDVEGIRVLHTL